MITGSNIEFFLEKYFASKKIQWLDLFIYEFYKHQPEEIIAQLEHNEKFHTLATQISYHLLELLFTTISDLTSNRTSVLSLRNILTTGMGGKIILLISDLHLFNVTNERELVNVMTKVFPNDFWECADEGRSWLTTLSLDDVKRIFSREFGLLKQSSPSPPKRDHQTSFNSSTSELDSDDIETFLSDDFKAYNDSFHISSAELSIKIIEIFLKLIEVEGESSVDKNSSTICLLNFSVDTLKHLSDRNIFNELDQTVIKIKITQLVCRCFNSLVKRAFNNVKSHVKKIFNLLELSLSEKEITCGLIMCIITTMGNLCIRKSSQKVENLELLKLCSHLVLKQMEILSDSDFLFIIQKRIMEIINLLRKLETPQRNKRKKRTKIVDIKNQRHHHSQMDTCIFDRLLIDSFPFVKSFKHLKAILSHLNIKKICCCNGDIKTIEIFMHSTLIAAHYLHFIEARVLRVLFEKSKICIYCNDKLNSIEFACDYFRLMRSEMARREGYELYAFLNHMCTVQKLMTKEFRDEFIFEVIVMIFEEEKEKYLSDTDAYHESRLKATICLRIITENCNDRDFLKKFLTLERINHLRDCSLVPAMSMSSCVILSSGLKLLDDQTSLNQIKSIFFSNILYLIHEIISIYDQIDLPRNLPLSRHDSGISSSKLTANSTGDASDFEVLDQQTVVVKENLSNLDVLLLNMVHWNILSELILKYPLFQAEFIANIHNNFHKNILFTIAYHALNAMLLQKETSLTKVIKNTRDNRRDKEMDLSKQLNENSLKNIHVSIICKGYDLNYEQVIMRSYKLFEICQKFSDKLQKEYEEETTDCIMLYRLRRDNNKFINLAVHRDNFLPESLSNDFGHQSRESSYRHQQHWINSFGAFFETKHIKEAISRVLNRFMRTDEELKNIHRLNTIKEITEKFGLKYLSAIARNCFDISFRLSSSHSMNTKMSTALDELKFLLLHSHGWIESDCESKRSVIDALQLLLGVAEMKTRGVNRMMFLNSENHIESTTESIFSELNASCEGGVTFSSESDCSSSRSGDRKTECYYTGDENYDGDEEYFSLRDETICSQSFKTASVTSALLDVKNTNEHICRLVVEILMELSEKFVEEDVESFKMLAQRLSCMKNYLGGAEFLLKGFKPILTKNSINLRAFQQAILELVDDINTTESLKNFFSILANENAPVEIIISRMEILCNKEKNPRPFCAVKYPIYCSETIMTSTCDTYVHGMIQNLKNHNKSRSPFVEASQIIPLNFFEINVWNSNSGFTISTWVELQTCEGTSTIHLLSIGSEKLLLAVFVNPDGTFEFIVIKPTSHHSKSKVKGKSPDSQQSSSASDHHSSDKENINKTNIFGIASAILRDREMPSNIRTRGSLRNKKKSKDDENSKQMETSRVIVKSKKSKLKCHQWTHVCLSLRSSESQISILLTLNATEHENIEIPIDGMKGDKGSKSDINGELQMLFIGSTISQQNANDTTYQMSNVTLFKTPLDAYLIAYLYALGPNCSNFSDCEIMQIMPLRGSLDLTKLVNRISLKMASQDLMKMLKSNILLTYAVGKSSYATGYLKGDFGKPLEIFTNAYSPTTLPLKSIARAVYFSGGLSALLFLFARTVELTNDPITQSTALYIFLKMAYSNNFLYAEFEQKKLFNLVAHVFKHGNCYRGPGILKAILDVIYGGTMFNKKSTADEYKINEKSELNIQNPSLLMKLLANFGIFQTTDQTDACNLDLLFKSLKVATRESHPYKHINRQCLIEHGFYEKLIEFCKIHLTNSSNSITLTSSTAIILVDLLKMLSKNPPIWIVSRIQELLMLLHHPSESFITHDRSKFNFILSNQKPLKTNRNSTIGSKFYSNFSTKIRSTNTSSLPASPTSSHRSSINNASPPKSPRLISSGDINAIFNEVDGKLRSFKGSTDSATSSTITHKFKTQKLDELSVSQGEKVSKIFLDMKTNKTLKTPTKVQKKRLKNSPKKSPFRQKVVLKKKSIEIEQDDQLDQGLIDKFDTLMSASSMQISEIFNRYEAGNSVLQENLFVMLKDAILSIIDNQIQMEIADSMSIESLIMFSNHPDGNVRSAIIELIQVIVSRQSQEMLNYYQKSNYWTHLGNQIAISPANEKLIETCINWIMASEKALSFEEILKLEKVEIKFKPGLKILVALIPSTTHDSTLFTSLINFLRFVIESSAETFLTIADFGLVNSCIRSLIKVDEDDALKSIQLILENIGLKSLMITSGIHVLWELLYGLTYAEKQGSSIDAIRDIHLGVLQRILSLCVVEQSKRGSKSGESYPQTLVVTKTLGNLPSSEIKTRFNLIHDRAVHFVISWEEISELKTHEVDFVKYLIDLYFAGIHQGAALLLWALSPTCNEDIKQFVTHKIIAMLTVDPNFTITEPKMLKALLYHLIVNNSSSFSEEQLKVISKYCGTSLSQQQQNFGWIMTAIEKVDILRQNAQRDQNQQVDKIIYKHETLVQVTIDGAMKMTRDVIDMQNRERRQLMNYLKRTQEIDYFREWKEVIQRMTHENAPWYNSELYPNTFELDETEGPGRMRIRLKRTALKINEKFFMDEFKHKASYQHKKQLLDYLLHPRETERYSINDQIVFTFNGKHLTLEQEIEGEIIVTDNQMNFLANNDTYTNSIICNIYDIDEVWDRRYQHKEIALEIFLKSSKNFFLIFETKYERDIVTKFLSDKIDKKEGSQQRQEAITQRWIENKMTNYEYLIELNKISGRSYNDLMQYPVFPWIITDYSSDLLDLTVEDSYRKLMKTISTQYEETEEHYVTNYNYLVQQMNEYQSIIKPYHYSSHYSNSGTVLHFLVRMPPFTNMFLLYQDHNFDIPDRTFHSLATTYRLTSKESATDVKELVPEFFYLPDFLINNEGFNYGMRQSGEQVNDIKLPPWCDDSARLFIFIHRQALESDFVRKQLHLWIDLIFGYRQKGKAAIEAVNVFHPATYPEFQVTNVTDIVERSAYETMVKTYGQMPKQIFVSPHKKSSAGNEKLHDLQYVLNGVKGLKWGAFTGSPQLPKPRKLSAKIPIPNKQRNTKLIPVHRQNMFFVIPDKASLMQGVIKNSYDLILWKENDGVVRTKTLTAKKSRKIFNAPICDPITACGSDVNYSNVWFGHQSGNISVYVRIDERQQLKKKSERNLKTLGTALESIIDIKVVEKSSIIEDDKNTVKSRWNYPITLLRHASEISSIKICTEFKIVVSIAVDGRTVIWDSQKIEYIRTIEPSCNTLRACLTHVDISPTLGDILTVFRPKNESHDVNDDCFEVVDNVGDDFINISMSIAGKTQLRLHNINAKYIGHTFIEGIVVATCFSFMKEGTGINVIAIALNDGCIRLYSTWNLEFVREIATACNRIAEISFSTNHYLTVLSDQEIHLWGTDGLPFERPSFHDIIFE